jgi:hypothetical protein
MVAVDPGLRREDANENAGASSIRRAPTSSGSGRPLRFGSVQGVITPDRCTAAKSVSFHFNDTGTTVREYVMSSTVLPDWP